MGFAGLKSDMLFLAGGSFKVRPGQAADVELSSRRARADLRRYEGARSSTGSCSTSLVVSHFIEALFAR